MKKLGFPETPDSIPFSGFGDGKERTKAAQEAYTRAEAANEKNDREADARWEAIQKREQGTQVGYVFAKSCSSPDGVINHSNGGFIPVESLKQYGAYAVLGTGSAVSAAGTALQWIGGSGSATALASRLGGSLAVAAPMQLKIIAALLMPNTTSPDSAFYSSEQYAELTKGNTRARVNVKHLPDGSVNLYGFYTGSKADWQNVPVIEAQARGEQLVAVLGSGIEVIWTPAADPNAVLGIPALEGASLKPGAWVYPPTAQADKILINPAYPPDYQDAIIWFPSTGIQPIYISLSVMGDHSYHPAPKGLTAFPYAVKVNSKTRVQGGGNKRNRWKDNKGRIYEWDSQHGAVEMYDKQGKHLGEFDAVTGEQTKPAKPGRNVEK
ncbi:colicin E3/pyocin S6 family cytotoxin [Pseudomonas sp. LS1212]|uniref:colicin E3/pyocin S6 family cytotoxin n=1 Tax=Pseudomonas sp. LS1212 TaxID=2972478 RepID=UPI00215D0E59|nr:colicin E3/pyocin S6 family cytotoxin [Pseudomonas sp. LS1212]UVJ46430.1 colicin E3/pyocin S6 family cytotoxin [Pseudomonas sp. LS1212]